MRITVSKNNPQLGDLIVNWREKICDAIFLSLSILGLIAYIPSFLLSLRDHLPHIALIDTVAYGIILLITFNKKISYKIKAFIGSIVFYVLGLLLLLLLGPIGAGNLWLLGFSLIAAFTLGEKAAKISFIINLTTQISFYILISNSVYIVDFPIVMEADAWLIRAVNFIVINLVIVISTTVLARQLNKTFFIQKEAEKKLAESEKRMRTMFVQAPLGITLIESVTGKILEVNPAFEKILGYNTDELTHIDWMSITHPDDIQGEINNMTRLFKGEISEYSMEKRYIHKDGSIIWVNLTITSFSLGDKNNPQYLAMVEDITQHKKSEEDNRILQLQLNHKSKMDAIGQLAGGMAHDFNNILTGIMGAAQLLQLPNRSLDEKSLKNADMILKASIRAADLIQKLLAFSRKENQSTQVLDLNVILSESLDILSSTIDKKNSISFIQNAKKSHILGDHASLENVFINIGINASQAMPDGGVIQFSTENVILDQVYCDNSTFDINPGEYFKISVSDTGSGILKENLHRIFEPFFTTKEQGKGTGLGLSAVYGTIQDHHGVIEVHSKVGVGSTFYILLPCSEQSDDQMLEKQQILTGAGTILLVDDEEMNRTLSIDIFESLGYQVILAEDGQESVEIFRKKHSEIDIVLMDMIMPRMNGSEAFYKMKDIDKNCNVIIASGYTKDEKIDELIKDGVKGFINKPYKISEISRVLDDVKK